MFWSNIQPPYSVYYAMEIKAKCCCETSVPIHQLPWCHVITHKTTCETVQELLSWL